MQGEKFSEKDKMLRKALKDRKRIVVKIGSSSLHHMSTGEINFTKMERLVRELCSHSRGR